ncbi:MAG: pilus assembly protein PilM [Lachnospiraceae bacterium]|nr:pilus assembly protein PilM [Lachnospiraceae bacterium]
MKVSVFLSNSSIQVVLGEHSGKKVKIRAFYADEIPEGTLLNGTIINEAALQETIHSAWAKHSIKEKSVDLVINSPHLMSRRIEMPLLKGSKADRYVNNEMDEKDTARFTEPVLGWYPVSKKKNTRLVISEMAEKDFIETYIRIFEAAGVKLDSIHAGINLAVNMMQTQVGSGTIVYMVLDGMNLTTILFAKGEYFNNLNTRVYSIPGTSEFSAEIRNAISSIRQFATAQHIEEAISNIYIAGLNMEEMNLLKNELQGYPLGDVVGIMTRPDCVVMNTGADRFGDYLFSIAGFFGTREGLSILEALKRDSQQYQKKKMITLLVVPYVAVTIVLLIATSVLLVISAQKKKELAALQDYNNQPVTVQSAAEYDLLLQDAGRMGRAQGGVDLLAEYRETYPIPDSSVNKSVISAAGLEAVGVVIDSYSAESGILEVVATAEDVEKINRFIARLMGMEIFELVDYTGYTRNEADNTWSIHVVCTMAEG